MLVSSTRCFAIPLQTIRRSEKAITSKAGLSARIGKSVSYYVSTIKVEMIVSL